MKKRIISLLMCLVMAFSIVPAAAWAEVLPSPQDTPDSGAGTAGVYTTGEDTVVRNAYGAAVNIGVASSGCVTILSGTYFPMVKKTGYGAARISGATVLSGTATVTLDISRLLPTLPAGQSYGTVEYKMGMILMDPRYYTSDNGAAIARAAAPARRCCCAASASTNNAEDDRPLAGHLLLPTAGKSGIIGIYETRRKEHGL